MLHKVLASLCLLLSVFSTVSVAQTSVAQTSVAQTSVAQTSVAQTIVVAGSGSDLETFRLLSKAYNKHHPGVQFTILPSIGSGGAVRGVITQRVDIGLMTRPINKNEQSSDLRVIPYADSALVFIVPENYPLKNISTEELKSVYSGVNAKNGLIPILRPKLDSDTYFLKEHFTDIVPALLSAYNRKGLAIAASDQSTLELLVSLDNAIATSTLSQVISEQRAVQVLSLNGVAANQLTIANASYPLIKHFYLVYSQSLAADKYQFINFIFSREGKEILRQTGHAALDLKK